MFYIRKKTDGTIELIDHSRIGVTISDTKQDNEEFLGKGHSYDIYDEDIISLGANHMVYMFKVNWNHNGEETKEQTSIIHGWNPDLQGTTNKGSKTSPRERKKPKWKEYMLILEKEIEGTLILALEVFLQIMQFAKKCTIFPHF